MCNLVYNSLCFVSHTVAHLELTRVLPEPPVHKARPLTKVRARRPSVPVQIGTSAKLDSPAEIVF